MRVVRRGVRRALAQLIAFRPLVAAALASGALFLIAASPAPTTTPPPPPTQNALTAAQMKAMLPKVPLHTEFLVQTNKLGQVTVAKPAMQSKDRTFNIQTYGNALQAFIRNEDGNAEPGTYKLTYDYEPKTQKIKRDVTLVKLGGVDPNKEGAALVMMDIARKQAAAAAAKAKHKP